MVRGLINAGSKILVSITIHHTWKKYFFTGIDSFVVTSLSPPPPMTFKVVTDQVVGEDGGTWFCVWELGPSGSGGGAVLQTPDLWKTNATGKL